MATVQKTWLVRTRVGEILGPYSEKQLLQELHAQKFSPEDEIASSGGEPWMSASLLQNREADEFTNTSTRNTSTHSLNNSAELTPTPSIQTPPVQSPIPQQGQIRSGHKPFLVPILTLGLVTLFALLLVSKFNSNKKETSSIPTPAFSVGEAESEFTKKVYQLIQSGETGTALKNLTEYHEKVVKKESIDYLIPYAALLIMEGESTTRAKKFLETVLSTTTNPKLKARAHHWLGYLLLSEDEGDMGEGHFLESLQLNPKDAAARFNLGRSYLKQEKYSQALDYLQLAELEMPDLWLVHIYKGRAKVALNQIEEARQSFKTAIQVAPDRWISHIYYALFLVGIRENAEARTVLKKMVTRDPQYELHTPAPFGYYQERQNYNEYLSAYNHVMEKAPFEEKELGKIYINSILNGGTDEDVRRFDVLAKNGSLTANVLALKLVLDKKPKNDELTNRIKNLPQNLSAFGSYAYVLRGDAKIRLGDLNGAQEDFRQALKLEPKSAVAHWALASLLERQSQAGEAQAEIERLLAYHPHYIPALLSSRHY